MADKIINFIGNDNISPAIENIKSNAESANNSIIEKNRELISSNEKVADSYRQISDVEFTTGENRQAPPLRSDSEQEILRLKNSIRASESFFEQTELSRREGNLNQPESVYSRNRNMFADYEKKIAEYSELTGEEYQPENELVQSAYTEYQKQISSEEQRKDEVVEKIGAKKEVFEQPKETFDNTLKLRAQETFSDIFSEINKYESDPRQISKYLKQEASTLDKQNKLRADRELYDISKEADPEKRKERLIELKSETQEQSLLISTLRELINAYTLGSEKQIREDKKLADEKKSEDKKNADEKKSEDKKNEDETSKDSDKKKKVDKEDDRTPDKTEQFLKRMFGYQATSQFVSTASNVIGSNNKYESVIEGISATTGAIGNLLAGIPGIGAFLGGLFKGISEAEQKLGYKALGAATTLETSASGLAQVAPGKWSDYTKMGDAYSVYGYDKSKFLNEAVQSARSYGTAEDIDANTERAIQLDKAFKISRGDISTAERMVSFDQSNVSTTDYVNNLFKGMQASGVAGEKKDQIALIPEYLSISNQISKEQLDKLGHVDLGINTKMITGIANLSDNLRNPDVLRGVVSNIDAGLKGASTPQIEALQFQTLANINPNKSFLELQMEREKGLSSKGYLSGVIGQFQQTGFSTDDQIRMVSSTFGTSLTLSRDILQGFKSGKFNEQEWSDKIASERGIDIGQKAKDTSNRIEVSTADRSNMMANAGEKMVDAIDGITDLLGQALQNILDKLFPNGSKVPDDTTVRGGSNKLSPTTTGASNAEIWAQQDSAIEADNKRRENEEKYNNSILKILKDNQDMLTREDSSANVISNNLTDTSGFNKVHIKQR